mmetsp:Transcript_90582/g.270261  ORF Transcript_90582/g.270261 Transcript_90582/m.270261 type:complete len:219 (-) Transcript_90582:70-726(-)
MAEPPLTATDMDQLALLLGECHLHAEERDALAQATRAASSFSNQQLHGGAGSCSNAAPLEGAAAVAAIAPWADELLQRLQGCPSPEAGRRVCAELLIALRRHCAGQPVEHAGGCTDCQGCGGMAAACGHQGRLQSLQGANRVITGAVRMMLVRQNEANRHCQQAEEAGKCLASELQRCQEQLRASERARAALESHLQLMRADAGAAVQVAHLPGPACT